MDREQQLFEMCMVRVRRQARFEKRTPTFLELLAEAEELCKREEQRIAEAVERARSVEQILQQ